MDSRMAGVNGRLGRVHGPRQLVGEGGFEPPTACPQSRCATTAPLPVADSATDLRLWLYVSEVPKRGSGAASKPRVRDLEKLARSAHTRSDAL